MTAIIPSDDLLCLIEFVHIFSTYAVYRYTHIYVYIKQESVSKGNGKLLNYKLIFAQVNFISIYGFSSTF